MGESDAANDAKCELKVKEIMSMRHGGNIINAKVIETLINETLADAEHLDIPGVVLKPSHKSPLVRYGIDRNHLFDSDVPIEMIDRIYRGLFVYSLGFYEMINNTLAHAKSKYTLIASVWKVFSILLEYCCKSNYSLMI